MMSCLAHVDDRLLEVDADALRYRMTLSRLRLGRRRVTALEQCVAASLEAELAALEALEAESVRQHDQQRCPMLTLFARIRRNASPASPRARHAATT